MKILILLAALTAAFFLPANAQPLPTLGDIIPGHKIVCDTEDQYRALWEAHIAHGAKGVIEATQARQDVKNASGEPVCGYTSARLMIVRVVEAQWIEWMPGKTLWTVFVEMRAINGRTAFSVVAMSGVGKGT